MEWVVGVTGSPNDLRELAKSLRSPELALAEEDGQFVIRSSTFDPKADASIIQQQAQELAVLMDGSIAIVLGRRQPLGVGAMWCVRDDGKKSFYLMASAGVFATSGMFASFTIKHGDGTEVIVHATERVPKWLSAATADEAVKKVLRYLSRSLDWGALYNIHEAIKLDLGGEGNIEAAEWATKKEQNRFTHTANNYQTLREQARHSREDWKPPANAMSLSEATVLVKTIAQARASCN